MQHSVDECVKGEAHTNGIESFWSTLKRAHKGTFHQRSRKHPNRYVHEIAGRHNFWELDTIQQMLDVVAALIGKRLMDKAFVSS